MQKRWIALFLTAVLLLVPLCGCALPQARTELTPAPIRTEEAASAAPAEAPQAAAASENAQAPPELLRPSSSAAAETVSEDETYSAAREVALYLHVYGHLPANYLTKQEAREKGCSSSEGNLQEVSPGACIGGDRFGNREGLLPEQEGRVWSECDVNYTGGFRGADRLIFSNDGLIYYTQDHYQSFTQLYDKDGPVS